MPYMRVVRSQFDPGVAEDLVRLSPDFEAAFRRLPGLQHHHGGADRAGGKAIMVGIFDTEEHARFDPAALGEVQEKLQALGLRIESRDIYEVVS
ncbi:MAG TPA: hypothetical protein VH475_03355 [Tepidisphaeraceae bacterium]|jgi:hypothetical protein